MQYVAFCFECVKVPNDGVFKAGKLQGRHSIVFSEWSVRSCISDREYHVSVF